MKKLFTLLFVITMYSAAYAQTYIFTDKDGTPLDNGAIISRTIVENEDIFMPQINADLFIKNNGSSTNSQVSIEANITKLDNGLIQLCFPSECKSYNTTGVQETTKTSLVQGESQNIQSEWLPNEVGAYGECCVTYTAKTYEGSLIVGKFSVTINYKYSNATGLENLILLKKQNIESIYNLHGNNVIIGQRGIYFVRMSDGRVRKIAKN